MQETRAIRANLDVIRNADLLPKQMVSWANVSIALLGFLDTSYFPLQEQSKERFEEAVDIIQANILNPIDTKYMVYRGPSED